jgi:hypothetical protein
MVYLYQMIRRLNNLGVVVLLLVLTLSTFGQFYIPKASAAADTVTLDQDSRKLYHLEKCLENTGNNRFTTVIHTGQDLTSYIDILGGAITKENVVVGLDISTANGVVSCAKAISLGINVLFPGAIKGGGNDATDIAPWLTNYLTGKPDFNDGKIKRDENAWKKKVAELTAKSMAKRAAIGAPSKAMLQLRTIGLVNICYEPTQSANKGSNYAFTVPGVGYFYERDANGTDGVKELMQKAIQIRKGGNDLADGVGKAYLGDLGLGWNFGGATAGLTNTAGYFSAYGKDSPASDFYPIGSDIGETAGYTQDYSKKGAVVDCLFVKKYKDIIFANIKVDATGGFVNKDGTPLSDDLTKAIENQGAIDNTSGAPDLKCDLSANPLTWFICPLITGATAAIKTLDSQINGRLSIPISGFDSNFDQVSEGGAATYKAWSTMRGVALSLLVIIALVMVISQAIGSGPFDAYTVKKMLPRIAIAVIGVSLSWQLCRLMIGISNDLGQGVGSLIYKPFIGLGAPSIKGGGSSAGFGALAGFFASGADILVVLSLTLTGLAAVFVAFLVVAFRNILAIILVIFAPAALILWILPNTSKAWKLWKESFSGVLLSFPIIVAFIAAGRVFAVLSSRSGQGLFSDIITFFAYFGPYFALPAAFRLAGGTIATISGMANDRSKGFFDRQKKFRGEEKKKAVHRREANNAFTGAKRTGVRASLNKGITGAYAMKNFGLDTKKWRNLGGSLEASHNSHSLAGEQAILEDAQYKLRAGDDNWNYAALMANDSAQFRQMMIAKGRSGSNLNEDVSIYDNMLKNHGRDALGLVAFDKTAAGGTVFGTSGHVSAMDAAARLARGNSGMQALLDGRIRGISANAGRIDEGGLSHGSSMAASNNSITAGYLQNAGGEYVDARGRVITDPTDAGSRVRVLDDVAARSEQISAHVARMSFQQSHGSQWVGPTVKNIATEKGVKMIQEDIDYAVESGNNQLLAESLIKLEEMRSGATTSEKREILANGVSRRQRSLDELSETQLAMLGPSIWTEEVMSGPTPDGRPLTRRVLKQEVDPATGLLRTKTISNAEMLDLSLGSKEMRDLSKQYNQPYEAGGAPPPGGPIVPPPAGVL